MSVLSTNNIWSVGTSFIDNTHQQTLIEHWDGTTWSIVPSPNFSDVNALYQIAAISASDIWAVGTASISALIEHWDGTSWSIVSSPSPGSGVKYLNGVTAISSTNVWAGGAAQTGSNGEVQTLIEHWDGTSWNVVPSPNSEPSVNDILNAVVRVPRTSSQIWAVGSYTDSNNTGQTLTEFYC